MSSPRREEALVRALAMLPPIAPNETHAARLRAQCRARLERPLQGLPADLESKMVGALSAVYAWQIVWMVVR